MIKDSDFYNKESDKYSARRYPAIASNYIQFFFKKRLDITIRQLKGIGNTQKDLSLLEVGCADGVVLRDIQEKMHNSFRKMVGIDTAEEMVKIATMLDVSGEMRFFVRGQEPATQFDVIIEIGVANYTDFDAELLYATNHLKDRGVYVLSIAGRNPLSGYAGGDTGYENFLPYPEYEVKIRNNFIVEKIIPVGFRVPVLWKIPPIARVIQPILEICFRGLWSGLFHEKIYVLKKR